MIAKIVPYMNSFTELKHVSIEGDRISPEFLAKFGAFEAAYDPQTYKTVLKTNLNNLVLEGGLEIITEPKNAYITARSPNANLRIEEDNALIPTSRPINIIVDLFTRFEIRYQLEGTGFGTSPNEFFDLELVGIEFFKGLKDFVFEEQRYNTLPNTPDANFDVTTNRHNPGRGCALFFKQGERNIFGLGDRVPSRFGLFPNPQAFINISGEISGPPSNEFYPNFPNLDTRPFLIREKIQELINRLDQLYLEIQPQFQGQSRRFRSH
jgi:hypothetical protein